MLNATYRRVLACVLLVTAQSITTRADDWPQWRGPKRNNISGETGLLKSWGSNGPPVLWMAKGIGMGYSSVSVVGNHVYTIGDGTDSSFVHALNGADKGKILWSSRLGKPGGGGGYAGPRATPTVDGDRVYALGQFGDLTCLKASD